MTVRGLQPPGSWFQRIFGRHAKHVIGQAKLPNSALQDVRINMSDKYNFMSDKYHLTVKCKWRY